MLRRLGARERSGLALLLVWVGWAAIAAGLSGQVLSPLSPYAVAPLALAAGVALGALIARGGNGWVVAVALLTTTIYLLVAVLATGGPAKGPTAYANANAALAVQLTGLTGLALPGATGPRRTVLTLCAVGAVGVALANRSVAAVALGVPLLALVLAMGARPARRHTWRMVAAVFGAVACLATAGAVLALAPQPAWPSWATRFLDQARHTMWSEALDLWRAHPLAGAGPGTFEQVSTLGKDPDTASAHSSVLQVGAETGWVGVALLLAIVMAGLLWAAQGRPAYVVVGAATWTALVVHSMTDHLVDFPVVVLTAGLVIGWSGASARSEELDVPEGQRPC